MQSEKAIRYRPAIISSNDLNEETNMRLVCNFGINDLRDQRKTSKELNLWCNMLNRCYSEKLHARIPTYKDCSTSKEFKRYSDFKNWCQGQIGFGLDDWQLDKDILQKGNKEYHPDKCVFIPKEINLFIRVKKQTRGEFLIGVKRDKWGNYIAQISIHGENIYLGLFRSEIDAFQAYKQTKEAHIKVLANKYKSEIDPRAYDALMNYQVEITD